MTPPRLAITMGDPAGIGPEIVAGALAGPDLGATIRVIGDEARLRDAAQRVGVALAIQVVSDVDESIRDGAVAVHQIGELPADLPYGQVSAAAGAASFAYLEHAIALARAGHVDAIVTAPIHKEAWHLAGIDYPDHTETLAHLTGAPRHAMMLATDELRTVLVTTHVSLAKALTLITTDRVLKAIELAHEEMRAQGIRNPRVAVAGVNPHAGEGGMFGDEEITAIAPAVDAARAKGIDATGPHPPDTVFMRARAGEFDIVIAQYHDQGLIPVKLLGIDDGVNATLGLPFVRTSVDHGTAFDIAGKGIADPESMITAVLLAARLARGSG
jgi:4-hydroxythreonine-4-phosphate dehydrogenase